MVSAYTGNVKNFEIVGFTGGANGNYLSIVCLNPYNKKLYKIHTNYFNRLMFTETDKIPSQQPISFDIKGAIIIYDNKFDSTQHNTLNLVKNTKIYIVEANDNLISVRPFGTSPKHTPEIHPPYDEYIQSLKTRKHKTSKTKSKRKPVKKCKCK